MRFKVRNLNISGGRNLIVVLNETTAALEGIHASSRARLTDDKRRVVAVVDLAGDEAIGRYEVGLFKEVADALGVRNGDMVEVTPFPQPRSVGFIKKKLDGIELSSDEINEIIRDVVDNKLSQVEMSAFVTACYTRELTLDETYYLINSVIRNGKTVDFNKKMILDKHCIGGIAGNRTTMLVVPIIASLGLTIPKTSSRSITSPAGTADTMEVLAPVKLTVNHIKKVVKEAGGCIVWGGAMNLAAADDKLISVRHPLALDPVGLMLASILAKKKAVNSNHVIIDIPLGVGGKVDSIGEAKFLARKFEELGERLGMKIKVLITDGNNPIGRGIGPVLEARDVLWILMNDERGPIDLRDKALYLSGELLELSGRASQGEGYGMAERALKDGKALEKFRQIIKLQGGKWKDPDELKPGKYTYDVIAWRSGKIRLLNNKLISKIAKMAGAPLDKGAGIYLHKQPGEQVRKGEVLMTIYAENKSLLENAVKLVSKDLAEF